MFKIKIKKLKVMVKIGTSVKEREKKQPIYISVDFFYKPKNNNLDNIKSLISYSDVIIFINNFLAHSSYFTLEKLISECSYKIKKKFKVTKVFVEVEKPKISKLKKCSSISVSK
ncbi:MAG: hypothetical protein CFH19_00166 [Alphaproteobacteria bacterium MarineAlpha5_Bin9]|nr:MAG: hypothetical protein CFH19_00166 [Alphaproteobacteria bacterium MarineAlpha5_Bin9]|tara:strand:+ start:37697 stop:38038 length:342 start_codon:yes stop_codon:yes gene_type:complete